MPMLSPLIANSTWWLSCLAESRRFHRATHHVAETQRTYLTDLLARNAETQWGQRHSFSKIRSPATFQAEVPLTTYEDYRASIEAIGNGEPHILTADPVVLLEPTSGSTSAAKLIPYTKSLQAEFQRGIAPWIADLFRHDPALLNGSAYWSVSPVAQRAARTMGGIPIGFEDDSAYLGKQSALVNAVMAVPSAVKLIEDTESFRYVTLFFLLSHRNLSLVSVWNPTFFTLLLDVLPRFFERLVEDIRRGTLTSPVPLAPDVHKTLLSTIRPNPKRATELTLLNPADVTAFFPGLRLLSCWTDANAAPYAAELTRRFPNVTLQGKGLLSTEGFISFPLVGQRGAVLSLRSHFFEFLPEGNETERPRFVHQLEQGGIYEVILTTGGGLYRYRMHDLVEVVGFYNQCPLLKFVGKTALVSDWFGEKLNERHVRKVVTQTLHKYDVTPAFVMLACDEQQSPPCYVLYIEHGEWRVESGENGSGQSAVSSDQERLGTEGTAGTTGTRGNDKGRQGTTETVGNDFTTGSGRLSLAPTFSLGWGERTGAALWKQVREDIEAGLRENFHYRYCRQLGQLGAVRVFQIDAGGLAAYQARCVALGQRAGDIKPLLLHRVGGWTTHFNGGFVGE